MCLKLRANDLRVIFLPIEIYKREFESRVELSVALRALDSCRIYIIDLNFYFFITRLGVLVKSSVLFKSLQKYTLRWISRIFSSGISVFLQDEESLVSFNGISRREDIPPVYWSRNDLEIVLKCKGIFCWSADETNYYSGELKHPNVNFVGNYRTSKLRPNFIKKNYCQELESLNKDYKQVILYCSTFVQAFREIGIRTSERQTQEFESENYPPELRWAYSCWREQSQITFFCFLEFIRLFSNSPLAKTHSLVIRPHPSENKEIYSHLLQDLPAVIVDDRYGIEPWLEKSEVIIGSNCTTLMESLVYGKPSISFLPKLGSEFDSVLRLGVPGRFTPVVNDAEGLLKLITDIVCRPSLVQNVVLAGREEARAYVAFEKEHQTTNAKVLIANTPKVTRINILAFDFACMLLTFPYLTYSIIFKLFGKNEGNYKRVDRAKLRKALVTRWRETGGKAMMKRFFIILE